MRYKSYQSSFRVDVRTGEVPSKASPSKLSCHFGRWVNPRDRAIFPLLQQPVDAPRTTYDLIEPSELKFPGRLEMGWPKSNCNKWKKR